MKKQFSKLDELVRAAREDAPVVSFEETSSFVASLAKKPSRPLWFSLKDAFAYPLLWGKTLQSKILSAFEGGSFAPANGGVSSVFIGRGFAAAAFTLFALMIFPALVHDTNYLGKNALNIVQNQVPEGNSSQTQSSQNHFSQTQATKQKLIPQKSVTQGNKTHSGNVNTSDFLAVIADSSENSNNSNTVSAETPEYGITTALRQKLMQSNSEKTTIVQKPTESVVMRSSGFPAAIAHHQESITNEKLPMLSEEANNPSENFWQRISLEARIAARTDIGNSSLSAAPFLANQDQRAFSGSNTASTPLQNISLGVYFSLEKHHSLGLEGGTEPFMTAQIQNTFLGMNTGSSGASTGQIGTSSIAPGTSSIRAMQTQMIPQIVRTTSNRAWFGAAYQYNADVIEFAGGVQPLARITLGGGELGAVGRTLFGIKFLAKERLSFVIAGEGAAVASSLLGDIAITPRIGATLGLSVKF